MRFNTLFRRIGSGTEIEVYRANVGYICTLSQTSQVPASIWRTEVKSIQPIDTKTIIVTVEEYKSERNY